MFYTNGIHHSFLTAKESLSTFAIGAVATGSCLTIFIIILSILYIRRKRKRQEQPEGFS